MKIIFAGTPPFAAATLRALHQAGHEIVLVLTRVDQPAGRGMKLTPSAVAKEALQLGVPVLKPASLKSEEVQAQSRAVNADVMVVAAYGMLLPPAVLTIPRLGCLNVHGSLLPRWRGAAPVARAIEAGDAETGICIMQMDEGLDTGAVLLEKRIAIGADETSATLFEKLTALGAEAMVEALAQPQPWRATPQPAEGVTYAKKINKAEGRIDWSQPAEIIERKLRAFDPFPGGESEVDGTPVKIWRAATVRGGADAAPGAVIEANAGTLTVQCGRDALQLRVVQKSGGKRMDIAEYLRGSRVTTAMRFA